MPELELYGDIGESWYGDGITGAYVAAWLNAYAKDAPEITVRINSVGGWVSEGISIYNILHSHKAKVRVVVDGFALSAASVIAMAGDEIAMMAGSLMMIHPASGGCWGTAADMDATSRALARMSTSIADIYAQRTGKPAEECTALMDAETWLTTSEALAGGFCTEVVPGKRRETEVKLPAEDKKRHKASARWLSAYKNTPDVVRQAYKATVEKPTPALAMAASEVELGDRVQVRAGLEHDGMHASLVGTVQILHGGPAVGIVFDGMDEVHKWYAPDEIEVVEAADAADGETDDAESAAKRKKKPMQPMKMAASGASGSCALPPLITPFAARSPLSELARSSLGELARGRAR
jgi:ATP-dependent Clp endopeptidase proteolytic subunit ClpP